MVGGTSRFCCRFFVFVFIFGFTVESRASLSQVISFCVPKIIASQFNTEIDIHIVETKKGVKVRTQKKKPGRLGSSRFRTLKNWIHHTSYSIGIELKQLVKGEALKLLTQQQMYVLLRNTINQ